MPDMDVPLFAALERMGAISSSAVGHRIIFHNIWIPLGFLAFAAFFAYVWPSLHRRGNGKYKQGRSLAFAKVFLLLAVGWLFHLLLDAMITGEVMPFYPLSNYLFNLNRGDAISNVTGIPEQTLLQSLDALLLLFWLWHEEFTHRIKDYF
jgi:membrane-bound metal-dependent hydrolase YbcI (DUF457 family)